MIQADWLKSHCLRVRLVSWEADSGVLICYVQTKDTEEHFLYTRPTYLQKKSQDKHPPTDPTIGCTLKTCVIQYIYIVKS